MVDKMSCQMSGWSQIDEVLHAVMIRTHRVLLVYKDKY